MKLDVLTPGQVIDINDLPLRGIRSGNDGLRIGALERMSDVVVPRRPGQGPSAPVGDARERGARARGRID